MEEDEYGDVGDDVWDEALTQVSFSQHLPDNSSFRKRRRDSFEELSSDAENPVKTRRRLSADHTGSDASADGEAQDKIKKKPRYRIREGAEAVPPAKIVGATQADVMVHSSPYRIRGPIYRKPRPEPKSTPQSKLGRPAQTKRPVPVEDYSHELDGLPSDFLSSPEESTSAQRIIDIGSSPPSTDARTSTAPRQRLVAPQNGLRQTTLFGGRAPQQVPASQAKKVYNYRVDLPPEAPTHHAVDLEAMKTWVYPDNLGPTRDYQFSIVKNALFNNLLVALPTGLGKTFIAATVMLNFYRWTKDAQIIFVAPTKPLVAQQVGACFGIVGIPRSATTMLTGEVSQALRADEWASKRVLFMTPQTLMNDLSKGVGDPKKIALLVVDEAHRAVGEYAYTKVVQFIRRFNNSFRILALTATPGGTVEAVQNVIDNLEIAKIEIRTESSLDIRQFTHHTAIDTVLFDPSEEMVMIQELLSKTLQPLVNQLCAQKAYYKNDPMSLTNYGLIHARQEWYKSDAGRTAAQGVKFMIMALYNTLASVAHSIKLLQFHGIVPFYASIKQYQSSMDEGKGGKYRTQILSSPDFRRMMDLMRVWTNKPDFVGHPKLVMLCDTVLNHFLDQGDGLRGDSTGPSSSRVIVFSEYRDSAEEISRVLNKHGPMIRASVFVGQSDSKNSEGMSQAKQQETIEDFKKGTFNVIVATSIGEEGLDIGQVDLIVCYDASGSPIRMLQRMGRTGRKRAGKVTLLLMRGKEAESFSKAKNNYEQIQKMISSGERFNFRTDLSKRIVPRDIQPVVEKRMIDIPFENSQDNSLPEPRRRAARSKKAPAKKFHMPDGVETGFAMASTLSKGGKASMSLGSRKSKELNKNQLASIPSLEAVVLSPADTRILGSRYQNVPGLEAEEVSYPDLTKHPVAQRSLLPIGKVAHGRYTERCVRLFQKLGSPHNIISRDLARGKPNSSDWETPSLLEESEDPDVFDNLAVSKPPVGRRMAAPKAAKMPKSPKAARAKKMSKAKKDIPRRQALLLSDIESDGGDVEQTQPPAGTETEGEGESIRSESVSEDEADLESLEDFLDDGTDQVLGIDPHSSLSSSPPPVASSRPFFEATTFAPTQSQELPDLAELLGRATAEQRSMSTALDSDDVVRPVKGRRRVVVEDDDSDE